METLFGPDGPGGQPGKVGNFTDSIGLSGPDGLVPSLESLGKGLVQLPITLAKLPGDFIKNPQVFLNRQGHIDAAAAFLPDYRKQKIQQQKTAEATQQAIATARGVATAHTILTDLLGLHTPQARQAVGQNYAAVPGMDVNQVANTYSAANSEYAGAKGVATEAGAPPALSDYVAPADVTKDVGAPSFRERLKEKQAQFAGGVQIGVHSANEASTTRNLKQRLQDAKALKDVPDPYTPLAALDQAGAFDGNAPTKALVTAHLANRTDPKEAAKLLSGWTQAAIAPAKTAAPAAASLGAKRDQAQLDQLSAAVQAQRIPQENLADAQDALASGNAEAARQLNKQRMSPLRTGAAGENYLLGAQQFVNDPKSGFKDMPPEVQSRLAGAVTSGDNVTAKGIMSTVNKVGIPTAAKVLSSPEVKEVQKQQDILAMAQPRLSAAYDSAKVPGDPDHVDSALFNPLMAHFPNQSTLLTAMSVIAPADLTTRKAELMANAGDSLNTYLKRFGTRIPQAEADRFKTIWVTGNEPSAAIFNAKHAAIQAAMDRDAAILNGQFEDAVNAASSMNPRAVLDLKKTRDAALNAALDTSRSQLAYDLAHAAANPDNQPAGELTPEEQALAAKYGIK